jgi:hypothetical protein
MEYLTDDDYKQAAENGIAYHIAYKRYYEYEWSKEDTINKPLHKPNTWPTYKALAHSNGIGQNTFYTRVRSGMTLEEAATTPLQGKGFQYLGGRITPEMWATAKDNGIKKNTLVCRIYRYGWDPERAVTQPVDKKKARKTY